MLLATQKKRADLKVAIEDITLARQANPGGPTDAADTLMIFLIALQGPPFVATLGWLVGVLAGAVFDVGLLFAIGGTPRLREHGDVRPMTLLSGTLLRIPAMLILAIGLAGYFLGGRSALLCYTVYALMAAAVAVSSIMLPLIATAANQIARRSIW